MILHLLGDSAGSLFETPPANNSIVICFGDPKIQIMKDQFKVSLGIIYLIFFSTGCQKEAISYQLSEDKLVEIITDIHISESATQHLSLSFRDSMAKVYLEQILAIHEVPINIFEPDYIKLKEDPKKLQTVYDKVIRRLNQLKLKKKAKEETDQAEKKR